MKGYLARSDLLLSLVRAGTSGDATLFRRALEALIAEERAKQHNVLADQLQQYLRNGEGRMRLLQPAAEADLPVLEIQPYKRFADLILPDLVRETCADVIQEQHRSDLLRSYGLEPRHKILLMGPPGNGKTSLAEALAYELSVPLLAVRYEAVFGSYLGETATRLNKVFAYARTRHCVLFFDEFDTIGKERGDYHDTGEVKRVVSSLLLLIDQLPSTTLVVAASNHAELLDRAAWRRFQLRLSLPSPTRRNRVEWFERFSAVRPFNFGYSPAQLADALQVFSFAELEQFSLDVMRQFVLSQPMESARAITAHQLKYWSSLAPKMKSRRITKRA